MSNEKAAEPKDIRSEIKNLRRIEKKINKALLIAKGSRSKQILNLIEDLDRVTDVIFEEKR